MTRAWRKLTALVVVAGALIGAPAAHASLAWDTASHNFGNQNVGTASAPKTYTLTAGCDAGDLIIVTLCGSPPGGAHNFGPPTVTGDGFSLGAPNTCSSGLMSTIVIGSTMSCTSTVTFAPTSAGAKTGALNTPTGPDIALSGTGVTPTTPTTQTPAVGGVAGQKKKKCKKGRKLKKGKCVKKKGK